MTDINKQNLHAILRTDLAAFVEKVFETIAPGQIYYHNWHIDAICHELTRCQDEQGRRLLITQPPRSLKSICTSVAFVAWALGRDPTMKFVCVSYSQDLARELARQFRLVVESDWYGEVFPNVTFDKITADEITTNKNGGRLAASVGGTLTGRGADIIIIDDPMKADDAMSETARENVRNWYSATLSTRLDSKINGSIIIVMQRLHEDDLAGHVIENSNYDQLNLPAIATEDAFIPIGSGMVHHRKEGDVLQPRREPMNILDNIKKELGTLRFSAQYQQQPVPADGNLVKRDWFKLYTQPMGEGLIVQSWDIATSTKPNADYSACVTFRYFGNRVQVLHIWRGKLTFPNLKRKVGQLAEAYKPNAILIEKAGPGLQLLQDLKQRPLQGMPALMGIKPVGDKSQRLEGVSSLIEAGNVECPEDAPWLGDFMKELLAFPSAKHDDQVDAFSQGLKWIRSKTSGTAGNLAYSAPIIVRAGDGFQGSDRSTLDWRV